MSIPWLHETVLATQVLVTEAICLPPSNFAAKHKDKVNAVQHMCCGVVDTHGKFCVYKQALGTRYGLKTINKKSVKTVRMFLWRVYCASLIHTHVSPYPSMLFLMFLLLLL